MNNYFFITIFLLLEGFSTKADVQEKSLPALNIKPNSSYLPQAIYNHSENPAPKDYLQIIKSNSHILHNQPKVIDDPLPLKVECVKRLDINFKNDNSEPILKGAVLTGLLFFNVYKNPLFIQNPSHEPAANHVIHVHDKIMENNKTNVNPQTKFKPTNHNIKADSSIESVKYIKNPNEVDVVPINYFSDPATKYTLFNDDDKFALSGSAPVVIYKAGDDIAFSKDTSVIDDYEHTFSEEEFNKTKKFNSYKGIPKSSPKATKNKSNTHKKAIETVAATSIDLSKTSLDSFPSADTQHLVTHNGKSESTHTDHGYFYDIPKIPFAF